MKMMMWTQRISIPLALAPLALVGACVDEPAPPVYEAMCEEDHECAGTGGTRCHEGLCVGPSFLPFGAELRPPSERKDLAITEIPALEINQDGQAQNLRFAESVWVRGRVVLRSTDNLSVAAQLIFSRPSRIDGTTEYVVSVNADRDVMPGEHAFEVRLPRTLPGELYDLTILPDDTVYSYGLNESPAEQAPPRRFQTAAEQDLDVTIPLVGEGGFKQIHGFVRDATGATGLEGMIVRAFGRLRSGGPLVLASSSYMTRSDGSFTILAPDEGEDVYEIEVTPGEGVHAPALRRPEVFVADSPGDTIFTQEIDPILFPPFALPSTYRLPVFGVTSSGTEEPAVGAKIKLSTRLDTYNYDTAIYEASAQVDLDGYAEVALIPGSDANRTYLADATPVEGSKMGAVWDRTIEVGQTPGTLAQLSLPARVYMTGRVLDASGSPARDVGVRPQLSALFLAQLDDAQRSRLRVKWPQVYTDGNGDFGVYVDAQILGLAPTYDLAYEPAFASLNPRWNWDRLEIPAGKSTWLVGEFRLPEATYHWGTVIDPDGFEVVGADLRVLLVPSDPICATQIPGCVLPARLMAQSSSDDDGEVTLVLPKGPPSGSSP